MEIYSTQKLEVKDKKKDSIIHLGVNLWLPGCFTLQNSLQSRSGNIYF